jgi:electron transfer flavoprotein alpha subunit
MERVLLLAFSEPGGGLPKAALESLTAAREIAGLLGASLSAGVIGVDGSLAAARLGGSELERCLVIEGAAFAEPRYWSDAAAAEALCRQAQPELVIAAGTSRWSRVMAGVSQRMGGRIDTHVCGWELQAGELAITRWYYRQRMKAALTRTQRPWFLLVDPGVAVPAAADPADPAAVELVAANVPAGRSRVVEIKEPPAAEQTIRPDAQVLFVAGAGWTKKQRDGQVHLELAERLILDFLKLSKSSLGGSKSMVDLSCEGQKVLSFMTHLNQVGQTGASPRHPKGLAACCHGEEPHVVGWRFVNERRAINTDPNCGWAQGKADVLYVADAFEVMARVNALLEGEVG